MNRKVAVAMSGGVDSSVAAALAVEKYGADNVFGVTMKLFCYGDNESSDKSCCSIDAINDAITVCRQIGIRHYVIDFEKEFAEAVIQDFVSEYEHSRTPNPCIICNSVIKFQYLLQKIEELGAEILVTGHYARIACDSEDKKHNTKHKNPTSCHPEEPGKLAGRREDLLEIASSQASRNDVGQYYLLKGVDEKKDQSYFLYGIEPENLSKIWFPIGEMTKQETRQKAAELGLKTAQKTESQDICFIQSNVAEFLSNKISLTGGDIVDKKEKMLGKHKGLPLYTIGQRKGLGGGLPETMYVVGFNSDKNELVVGRAADLESDRLEVDNFHWLVSTPSSPFTATAKIRYNSEAAECKIYPSNEERSSQLLSNNKIIITFDKSQSAITPGQSVVIYDGEIVLGGGIISATL